MFNAVAAGASANINTVVMEPFPDRDQSDGSSSPHKALPTGGNKVERLARHTQALIKNLAEWVEWRIQLARIEVEERIQAEREKLLLMGMTVVFGALAGFFLLVTMALGIGWLLGHPFWGFAIVMVMLAILAAGSRVAWKEAARRGQDASEE